MFTLSITDAKQVQNEQHPLAYAFLPDETPGILAMTSNLLVLYDHPLQCPRMMPAVCGSVFPG